MWDKKILVTCDGEKGVQEYNWQAWCAVSSERKRSIGRRISEALTFKKLGMRGSPKAVEASPPSVHVKFQQEPHVID
jgi:hypothetical protein